MPTLVDERFRVLRGLGYTGATSDMILQWLQANGATSNAIPDAWREALLALTGLPPEDYHRNDYWREYLLTQVPNPPSQLNDLELAYWSAL